MIRHKLQHIPNDYVIDLSSDEAIERATNAVVLARKHLPKAMVRRMLGKSDDLLEFIPDSPAFFKGIRFDGFKQDSNLFNLKALRTEKKLGAAIEETRVLLNDFIENRTPDPRKRVKKLLDRFPESPDLHAMNAIYHYYTLSNLAIKTDVSRVASNRMDEDRLKSLKRSLQEMVSALFNDCINVYYVTWFVQIYNDYLSTLSRMLSYNYSIISQERDIRFKETIRNVHLGQLKVKAMILKKEELESFHAMCRMVSNSGFAVFNLSHKRIKETVSTLEKSTDRKLSLKVNVNNVLTLMISILTLFAKIPVFTRKKLVLDYLKQIPDLGEEMEMRKRVVMIAQYASEYRIAVALGDLQRQRATMRTIYQYCLDCVEKQMEGTVPSKWHATIIMRIAWVATNASDQVIFNKNEYEILLRKTHTCLGWITSNCTIPTNAKRAQNPEGDDLRQSVIDKAILSRNKVTEIARANGINLDETAPE